MRCRRQTLATAAVVLVVATLVPAVAIAVNGLPPTRAPQPDIPPPTRAVGVERLAQAPAPLARLVGVATFSGRRPTAGQQAALAGLGLRFQVLEHLPLAIVAGTREQLAAAVDRGAAADVYPDDRLEYLWEDSNRTMRADVARQLGFTGKGVQVAVVDSGVDATHPDLADHVVHNVKLVGPEYANLPPDAGPGTLVIPVEDLPYQNSDLTSGHGTHVAGIIAADGHTDPSQTGVAPDAEIVSYGIGDALFTTAVISAYDHILDHPEWGVDVVNNSWGSGWQLYDPAHPINVATRAVAERGVVVVFAAGNNGSDQTEMTLNPFSMPPWVLSVAAGTVGRGRADFSSNGLVFDNALPAEIPADGHLRFEGDRIGLYHPDVTAPGEDVVSSSGPTALLVGPAPPGGTVAASGTSMASPHAAGAAAVLLQANPRLTPAQVRQALQATAVPLSDGAPFWQAGYGYVDLGAAVQLVRRADWGAALARAQAAADARVLAARDWRVRSSDLWTWPAPLVTVAGVPDQRSFSVAVPPGTGGVKATIAFPSLATLGTNGAEYQVTVKDAAGTVVGQSTASASAGTAAVFVDLINPGRAADGRAVPPPAVTYGTWTFEVTGVRAVADPDTIDNDALLGRSVTLQVALVEATAAAARPARFVPTGALTLLFQPGEATALISPEGCQLANGAPTGGLAPTPAAGPCQAGAMGWPVNGTANLPAVFTSGPLTRAVTVGGPGLIAVHLADVASVLPVPGVESRLTYALEVVDGAGEVVAPVAGGEEAVAGNGRSEVRFLMPPVTAPAGTRLRLTLRTTALPLSVLSAGERLLYGGEYGDAGLALTVGRVTS